MKKYLLIMLAALAFVSCSKDDEKEQIANVPDYASYIDMSYANMIKSLGEPEMNFGSYYAYSYTTGNVEGLTIAVNTKTQTVYMVMEILKEGAFTTDELKKYFASKYTYYGVIDEMDTYGNAAKIDDATLVIGVSENSIVYENPNNIPEEVSGNIDGTPVEVVAALVGNNIDALLEQYPDAIVKYGDIYMINYEDDDYLMSVMPTVGEDGTVTGATILYNEDLSDDEIIAYYTSEGYSCEPTGKTDEETGKPIYMIVNLETGIYITYCDSRGVVLDLNQMGTDDEDEED